MESWCQTACTQEASAFAHMGAEVKILTSLQERTSTRQVRFHVSAKTLDGRWNVNKIRSEVKSGKMQQSTPAHPYLTMRRAFANRDAIIQMQTKGTHYRLVSIPRAPGIFQFMPGDLGLPGVAGKLAIVVTRDIKVAAALVTAGHELLRIDGTDRAREYTLNALPLPSGDISPVIDAPRLLAAWRGDRDSLRGDLPFVLAAGALEVAELMRREVAKSIDSVILSKKGTKSHVSIRADATDKAWSKATKFLAGK